ncbi:peptide chain release factor N(5)-glutamine methyltransferase [Aquabacterium sp.]|uniref:peptide chain release factor N(5)-glutamine methyltransferase n=1 Tax=Aquabacterium sp. TaxID=1872578 RepID=UPI00248A1321|nr:peptide chain release factor N(5)-glutamine methyltransferase [Aquabacterium sp.]MDI1258243.1 peptide chain release factor N(5)-glutamine methyltransferase [Aquabacterium sp.]
MSEPLPTPTVAAALQQARQLGVDRLDAQILLSTVLQRPRSWLLAHDQDALPPEQADQFMAWAQRRAQGEPLAYLLGDKEFYGLTLRVSPDVLIPRPDTETLVDWALELIPTEPGFRVLDLGTGSGAIALALQHQRPQARVTAVDASPAALAIAQANARQLALPVDNLQGSWFEPVAARQFDLIVSNPPYIAENDHHLQALAFEPKRALTSGVDGLDDLRLIISNAPSHLTAGGWLLMEHGHDQAAAVSLLLEARGFSQISTRHDLGGNPRCTGGKS